MKVSNNDKILVKFYLSKLKKLVLDDEGKLTYIENLDEVLYDIFGVKNFTKHLNQCYDNRDTMAVLSRIGYKYLNKICKSNEFYGVFAELVTINREIEVLRKRIKKASNKGKKKKDLLEEYDYLMKLYKKVTKRVRKIFGIKSSKKSYKRRYSALSNLVDSDDYYDDDSTSSVLYNSDFDDDDDDDDDDMDEMSELDRFRYEFQSRNARVAKKGSPQLRSNRMSDIEDDDDDDDEDLYDEDGSEKRIDKKINMLADTVSNLVNTVQYMSNVAAQSQFPAPKPQRHVVTDFDPATNRVSSYDVPARPVPARMNQLPDPVAALSNSVQTLITQQSEILKSQNWVINKISAMDEYLGELNVEEDGEFDDEVDPAMNVQVAPMADNAMMQQINKHQDPYSDMNGRPAAPQRRANMTRSELIDKINSTDPSTSTEDVE